MKNLNWQDRSETKSTIKSLQVKIEILRDQIWLLEMKNQGILKDFQEKTFNREIHNDEKKFADTITPRTFKRRMDLARQKFGYDGQFKIAQYATKKLGKALTHHKNFSLWFCSDYGHFLMMEIFNG